MIDIKLSRFIPGVMLLFSATTSWAITPFSEIITSALNRNGNLNSERLSAEAASLSAAAEAAPDGPEVEFEYLWNNGNEPNRWSVGVAQEFALPPVYSSASRVAGAEAEAAAATLLVLRADKALSIKESIIDIINANALLSYYEEVGERLNHISEAIEKSFSEGEATVLDRYKIRIAIINNDNRIAESKAVVSACKESLSAFGIVFDATTENLLHSYPEQTVEAPNADNCRLLHAVQDARILAAKAEVRKSKVDALPRFKVGFAHAFEDGHHFNGFTVGMSLPSFGSSKRIKAADRLLKAEMAASTADIDVSEAENRGEYRKALQLKEILDKYAPFTSDNTYLSLLTKAFDGGSLNVVDYITEINLFSESRLAYIDLNYRYNLALARLNRYRSVDFF